MMHVRKIKRVLAAHGLHLAWSKDTRDNPPEIERYSEGLKMILKEVAENTNRTEEQVWKTVRRGAAILGITNDDASVAMLIHPVKKHDSKPSE